MMKQQLTVLPLILFLAITSLVSSANAVEWADKMFETQKHDFGTVARGVKSEFVFELTNIYEETVHISSVRANCGCVTPTITQQTLKTWEKGGIHARFNTGSFIGQRKATITVTIDKPYFAEVQLNIVGNIRNDIHLQPGVLDFQLVGQGKGATQVLQATRYNNPGWKIQDVLCMNRNYEVVMKELERSNQRVRYELNVTLLGSHETGAIHDDLIIVSNDSASPRINVPMEGEVQSALTLSPSRVDFGDVVVDQPVTRKVFLKSAEPLEIVSVSGENSCLSFETKKMGDKLTVITITLTPKQDAEHLFNSPIQLRTNLGKEIDVTLPVTARLKVRTASK